MRFLVVVFFIFIAIQSSAQENPQNNEGQLHGNFQADIQYYNKDSSIGAPIVPEKLLMNSYANFNYSRGKFAAGVRFEGYMNTLQGFPNEGGKNNGFGVPIRWAIYKADELEITVGNYYDQFGSGLIFRSYEDKNLGYDNAMDGVKLKYEPFRGIALKGIIGYQRLYFEKGPGIVRGVDGEINLNEAISFLSTKLTQIIFGGSFVSKYQKDEDPIYKLPENVGAFAGRMNITHGKVAVSAEYAYKINDPSGDNNFIYKPGEGLIFNASYSQKGLGILFSAKRLDNMSFRSDRNANLNNLSINYLPSITKTHTYNLAAMYPYATQPNGELGAQAEVMYKIPKESLFGGRYGTGINVGFSRANNIKKIALNDTIGIGERGTDGYKSDWFDVGDEIFFQDFNIEINKKFTDKISTIITYQNLIYNYDILRGTSGHGSVYSDVVIVDFTYKFRSDYSLRTELQHMYTKQDQRNWAMGLMEFTIPNWFFTVFDQWNYGNEDANKRIHYFSAGFGYIKNANRIQITYGKQREGIMCVGGVCRAVPASNGVMVSISSTF